MRSSASLLTVAVLYSLYVGPARSAEPGPAAARLLLEAENFDDGGGQVIDRQFMDQKGSPY